MWYNQVQGKKSWRLDKTDRAIEETENQGLEGEVMLKWIEQHQSYTSVSICLTFKPAFLLFLFKPAILFLLVLLSFLSFWGFVLTLHFCSGLKSLTRPFLWLAISHWLCGWKIELQRFPSILKRKNRPGINIVIRAYSTDCRDVRVFTSESIPPCSSHE